MSARERLLAAVLRERYPNQAQTRCEGTQGQATDADRRAEQARRRETLSRAMGK